MSTFAEDIARQARSLPPEERVRLAEELLATVQAPDAELDAAWDAEIRQRLTDVESGKVRLLAAEEVFAELRQLLR